MHRPLGVRQLCKKNAYYAMPQCSKKVPIMLNICAYYVGGIVFRFKKRHIPFHVLPDSVSPLTFKCFSVSNILYDNT